MGTNINLTCGASSAKAIMYRWMRKSNKNIPSKTTGVTTSRLIIPNIALDDSGDYICVVSSDGVHVSSEYATVTVLSEL